MSVGIEGRLRWTVVFFIYQVVYVYEGGWEYRCSVVVVWENVGIDWPGILLFFYFSLLASWICSQGTLSSFSNVLISYNRFGYLWYNYTVFGFRNILLVLLYYKFVEYQKTLLYLLYMLEVLAMFHVFIIISRKMLKKL